MDQYLVSSKYVSSLFKTRQMVHQNIGYRIYVDIHSVYNLFENREWINIQ